MEQMVNLTIDNVKVSVPAGTTVLEAAKQAGINIPTLCYLKDVNAIGACRMCVVNAGGRALQAACVLPVSEGMNVKTNTPQISTARTCWSWCSPRTSRSVFPASVLPTVNCRSCAANWAWKTATGTPASRTITTLTT